MIGCCPIIRQQRLANLRGVVNAVRQAEKQRKELERHLLHATREQKQRYVEARKNEVTQRNREISLILNDLGATLSNTLQIDDTIRFDDLRKKESAPTFKPDANLQPLPPPNRDIYLSRVIAPSKFQALLPGAKRRYDEQLQLSEEQYREAVEVWKAKEQGRIYALERNWAAHQKRTEEFLADQNAHNARVDQLESDYLSGKVEVVEEYCPSGL